jgi:hypothetical protein
MPALAGEASSRAARLSARFYIPGYDMSICTLAVLLPSKRIAPLPSFDHARHTQATGLNETVALSLHQPATHQAPVPDPQARSTVCEPGDKGPGAQAPK